MSNKDELTLSAYHKLRREIGMKIRGDYYEPGADDLMAAERLIDAGYIDIKFVMGLPT